MAAQGKGRDYYDCYGTKSKERIRRAWIDCTPKEESLSEDSWDAVQGVEAPFRAPPVLAPSAAAAMQTEKGKHRQHKTQQQQLQQRLAHWRRMTLWLGKAAASKKLIDALLLYRNLRRAQLAEDVPSA